MEFAAKNNKCTVSHYRTAHIIPSKTIASLYENLSLVQNINLKETVPYASFFKKTANYIAAYLRKMSSRIAHTNGQILSESSELIVLKLRGNDKNCALYYVNDNDLFDKLEKFGVNKNKQIVYLMSDMLRDNQYTRTLRNYFKNYYMFESYDLPMIFQGLVSFIQPQKFIF